MNDGKYDWVWQNELDVKRKDNQERQFRTKRTTLTGLITVCIGLIYTITSVTGVHSGAYYYGIVIIALGMFIIVVSCIYLYMLIKAKRDLVAPVVSNPLDGVDVRCDQRYDQVDFDQERGMQRHTSYISTVTENSLSANVHTETTDVIDYYGTSHFNGDDKYRVESVYEPTFIVGPSRTKDSKCSKKKSKRTSSGCNSGSYLPNEIPIPIQ